MKKSVLITGAADGLGKATALAFADRGWHVIATDKDREGLESLSSREDMECLFMDVTSDGSVGEAFRAIRDRVECLDLVINNAGMDRYFPFSEEPASGFQSLFELNLFGACRVNQTFLPLVRKPGGRIIHIGSESHHLRIPFMPYPLTKRALEGYSKVLRQELRFSGIDVVEVRPGAIRTRLLANVSEIHYPVAGPGLREAFGIFSRTAAKEVGKVMDPGQVARFIVKVSEIPHPKAVYRINNSLKLRIAERIPFRLQEKLISWKLRK